MAQLCYSHSVEHSGLVVEREIPYVVSEQDTLNEPPHGKTNNLHRRKQRRSNCEADQRLCFHYSDSAIPLLLKYKISSLYPSSVTVQAGLCKTWSEPKLLVFSRTGSNPLCTE